MEETTQCGLFFWRPTFLQPLASKKMYMFVYSLLGIVQGMGFSYLSTTLSTIEKQFGIKSSESAWINSGNEVSQILFIFLLPFLPKIKKRTLWTSISMLFSAFGFFMCALPYIAKDKSAYKFGWNVQQSTPSSLCMLEDVADNQCKNELPRDWGGLLTIFFGFVIVGFGTSFYWTFGIPFIDDNISKKNSPFALGVISAARTLGPALGALLGNACLKLYVIPGYDVGLKEGDPGWLGAWWLGFVIIAALTAIICPFLALFPERLPSKNETDAIRIENNKNQMETNTLKDYYIHLKLRLGRLARNKVYVYSSLSTIAYLFGIVGFATFIPKMFEFGFRQKASSTGGISGMTQALGSSIGLILSGWLIGRFKFSARVLQMWAVVVGFITVAAIIAIFQINCPVELTVYDGPCSKTCFCSDIKFEPVCSEDGATMFHSPCSAGCRTATRINDGNNKKPVTVYSECVCVEQAALLLNSTRDLQWWNDTVPTNQPPPQSPLGSALGFRETVAISFNPALGGINSAVGGINSAVGGFCPADCSKVFYTVAILMMMFSLLSATTRVGTTIIGLRTVEPGDKSASLLIMVSLLSLLAFLPSPIIVGKIIDDACIVWGENCGEKTSCLLYNNQKMRTSISIFASASIFIATVFDLVAWFYCKDLKIFDETLDQKSAEILPSDAIITSGGQKEELQMPS